MCDLNAYTYRFIHGHFGRYFNLYETWMKPSHASYTLNREGMDVGRSVQGEDLVNSKYRILSINSSPEDEL